MKNGIISSLIIIVVSLIIGIAHQFVGVKHTECNGEYEDFFYQTEVSGISMAIKKDTLKNTGATIIIKDNNGDGTYIYGSCFRIEEYKDNKWNDYLENGYCDDLKDCLYICTDEAYYTKDGILEMEHDWKSTQGIELPSGKYRLIKTITLNNHKPVEVKDISIEFTIE